MAEAQLLTGSIRGGVWQGVVRAGEVAPPLEVVQGTRVLDGLTVTAAHVTGQWAVRVPVPADALSDGVHTFLVRDTGNGAVLGHFTIIAGVAMEDDIRAELDLLRAELDLLKRAFRRHCVETADRGGPAS